MSERSWSFIACLRMDIFIKERHELSVHIFKEYSDKENSYLGKLGDCF